ncbi:MAG: DeoR/GlpR family DNA-binding transcription regulator, partial [Candidatus Ornithospirochaeta sp.]
TLHQKAELSVLAEQFNTTEATIRRDLIELEKTKLIVRTHGGAIRNELKKAIWQTSSLHNRLDRNRGAKEKIAEFAATLIGDNESIILDGGSTTQILAPFLNERSNMLFVTNSPDIADILLEGETNHIIQVGGEMTRDTHQATGPDAEDHIRKYYVDWCITGVTGIDPDVGTYAAIPSEASLKKTMKDHARECMVIVDSSKFSRKAFSVALRPEDIDIVVTDSGAPKEMVDKLRERGIKVFVV